jgi:hypothetical protein
MGCSACSNFEHEQQSEMINENSSQIENNIENINSLEEKMNTEYINLKQKRENEIFDFFIDIRQNPKKYIEESVEYEINDILITAYNNKLFENKIMLIQNPFFNLYLDSYIQKYPNDKDSILFDLENNEQLKDYEKSLFGVKTNSKNNKDFVWLLLKENKNIALDEILYKNYDFFLISTESFSEETIAYFLFLKKI